MANPDLQKTGDLPSAQGKESEVKIIFKFKECHVCSSDCTHVTNRDNNYENNYGSRGHRHLPTVQKNTAYSDLLSGIDSTCVHETEASSSFRSPAGKDSAIEPHGATKSETAFRKKKRKKRKTVTSGTMCKYLADFSISGEDGPPVSPPIIGDSNDMDSSSGTEYSSATSFGLFDPATSEEDDRYLTIRGVGLGLGGKDTDEEESDYKLSICLDSPSGIPGTDYGRKSTSTLISEPPQVLFDANGVFIPPEKGRDSLKDMACKVISNADYKDAKSRAFSSKLQMDGDGSHSSCDNIMDAYLGSSPIIEEFTWKSYYDSDGDGNLSSLVNSNMPMDVLKSESRDSSAKKSRKPTYSRSLDEENLSSRRNNDPVDAIESSNSSSSWSDSRDSGRDYFMARSIVSKLTDSCNDGLSDHGVRESSADEGSFVSKECETTLGSRVTTAEGFLMKKKKKKKNKVFRFFQSMGKRIRKLKE